MSRNTENPKIVLAAALLAFAASGRAEDRTLHERGITRSPAFRALAAMAGAEEAPADAFDGRPTGAWGELKPGVGKPVALAAQFQTFQTPNLSVPDLRGSLPRGPAQAPVPDIAYPVSPPEAVQPVSPAHGGGGGGGSGRSACDDLRSKARRLRSAADSCDADVARGAPYCNVDVTFRSPSLPSSLRPSQARYYAGEFDRVAGYGDEYGCAAYGGEGSASSGGGASGALQPPGSGVGPVFRRTWSTRIYGGMSAAYLMLEIKHDINKFSYGNIIANTPFTYVSGPNAAKVSVGNVYSIDGPARWDPYVKVTDADSRSFELTTLQGHPEAGRVRFMAYDDNGSTVFTIRVLGHPSSTANQALYTAAGYFVQTRIWDNFTENVRAYSRGISSTPVERTEIKETP